MVFINNHIIIYIDSDQQWNKIYDNFLETKCKFAHLQIAPVISLIHQNVIKSDF